VSLQLADYQILEPMADSEDEEIYVAVPPARLGLETDRVLVKVVRGVSNDQAVKRATDELRIFATVASPYLVRLHDAGQEDDALFYAMDFPTVGTLKTPARELPLAIRLRAVAHAARGAHALHEAGVVHRTIAPSRVLLDETGAKLAGLGLARFVSPGLLMNTMPHVRQIDYLDPALLRGSPASRASDIWSLGAVLHFAASGGLSLYPVLPEGSPLGSVRQVLGGGQVIDPGIPAAIADVVRACLAADPAKRPASAAELADQIDRAEEAA
jgi:serine/threonine protein kinase